MKSSFERCPGKRLPGCLRETKFVLLSWLRHGPSRKSALLTSLISVMLTVPPFSVLGWVPGLITMVIAGIFFWITSITMHKFIMKHPEIKDICKSTFGLDKNHLDSKTSRLMNLLKQATSYTTPLEETALPTSSLDSCCSPTISFSSASTFLQPPRSLIRYQITRNAPLSSQSSPP